MKVLIAVCSIVLVASVFAGLPTQADWANLIKTNLGSSVCIDPKTVNPTVVEKFQKLQPLINKTLIDNKEQLKGKCETVRNQCQTIIRNNFACIDAAAFANQMSQYCIEITKA